MRSSPPPPPPGSPNLTYAEMKKLPTVSCVRTVPVTPIFEPKYRTPPSPEPTPEQIDAQRQAYLKSRCPLHLLAMQQYNQRRKEGITCFGDIGDLHMIFWLAIEKVDKSASKYFCATVHELSPVEFHVPFVDIFPGDPYKLGILTEFLCLDNFVFIMTNNYQIISCEICGLKNRQDFEKKAKDLADRREQERLDSDNKISTSWDSNCDEGGVMDKTNKRKHFDEGDVMEETRKKKGKFVEGSEKMRCKDPAPQPQGGDEVQVEMDQMKVEEGMGIKKQ
ncbi:hypothetical protein PIB30_020843 [Stylosanthes scabra]|uniref:Uncharacterized protein n=1 Tax=Stylosanthes scabra TaxID=79078 RepID=A0ABU6V7K6_9FABA|nr:hypothetical protein [Stylosanthes scabra]